MARTLGNGHVEGSPPDGQPVQSDPRLSRLAVASAVFGGLGLMLTVVSHVLSALMVGGSYGYLDWSIWVMLPIMPLPPLAAVIGSVAIVQIREQPDRLRGMALAVGGTVAGVAMLMGGLGIGLLALELAAVAPIAGIVALILRMKRRGERAGAAAVAPPQVEEETEPPAMPARPAPTSGLAVVAFVLGVLTFPTFGLAGVAGVPVGIVALVRIGFSRGRVRGVGLALAGTALSAVALGIVGYLMFVKESTPKQKAVCLSNVKNIALALQMYLADNDDVFPPSGNWCERVEPYVRDESVFRCPAAKDRDLECAYAYNAALSGVSLETLVDPVATVAIFESDKEWNAAGGLRLVAIEPRHLGGDNYGFADGHAAWLSRERMLSDAEQCRWEVE